MVRLSSLAGATKSLPPSPMQFVQTKAKIITDVTGVNTELPVLLTPDGVLEPLVDYLLAHSHVRSPSWMRKVLLATRLFLQYGAANANYAGQPPAAMFQQFVQRLYSGTIGADGLDPSGLFWEPLSAENARTLIRCLTDFSDWLSKDRGTVALNPRNSTSAHDRMLEMLAAEYRRNQSFLGHVQEKSTVPYARQIQTTKAPKIDEESAIAFPDEHFSRFVTVGFSSAGISNLRDILITLLMHGAGFRLSECFHLWIHDVTEDPRDPSLAAVRIHHPQLGSAPLDWLDERGQVRRVNREAYLNGRYAFAPRNKVLGNKHAGWKNPMLDGKHFMQAYWFPADYGRLFLTLWRKYLRQIIPLARPHPYAFVNLSGSHAGGMYCLDTFQEAHKRAILRCGLAAEKEDGTTPHGHRHSYGRALRRAGVHPRMIQKALHHKALSSQAVYTAPTMDEVSDELNQALEKLSTPRNSADIPNLGEMLRHGFSDIDPEGLLSGETPKLQRKQK